MRNLILLFSLILIMATCIEAAEIRGKIVDQNQSPIEGANIQTGETHRAVSDQDGSFILNYDTNFPEFITVSHVSFQPRMINIKSDDEELKIVMSPAIYPGQKIRVTAMRAQAGLTPAAFTDFTEDEIERDYTVGDFPMLLSTTPNVYAYSYTGGITGATDFKIRGFDAKRISVYVNGIPLNDPEDRFTYFYDLADFAAEVADIQVQRGVGNSFYGDATFGGSINIASAGLERKRRISVSTGYGRYYHDGNYISDVRKQALEYSSGLIDGRWSFAGRYSKLYSGGYRQGSWYDGWAYFLSLSRIDPNMTTTVNLYGGPMRAHQAWYGIDRNTQWQDRTFNPTNYANEVDDFNQPHYELHNNYKFNEDLTVSNSLYYIRGKGYYEEYRNDYYSNYAIPDSAIIDPSLVTDGAINLVRQKWVAKNQYGWNPRIDWDNEWGQTTLGGSFYYFESEHWGELKWAENVKATVPPHYRFYEYFGKKSSASFYALEYFSLSEKIKLMGNIQLRYMQYEFDQSRLGALPGHKYELDWLFLSPRAGIIFQPVENADIHASLSVASREPADNKIYDAEEPNAIPQLEIIDSTMSGGTYSYSFGDPKAKAERLYNLELGGNYRHDIFKAGINLFYMRFDNEIVPNGSLDFNGLPALGNAERSVHAGIELDGALTPLEFLTLSGNASYNYNRIKEYIAYNDIYYDGSVIDTVDYADNPVPGFPEYIVNGIADFKYDPIRFTYRLRAIGKQYVENGKNDSLAIGDFMVSSVSLSVNLGQLTGLGQLALSGHIENLWNAKYEQSGYAYWYGDQWYGEYYPAAERNFFVQLKWSFE